MKTRLLVLLAMQVFLICAVGQAGERESRPTDIEDGVLDSIHLKVAALPEGLPIFVKPFSTEGVDLGTGAEGGKDTRVEAAKAIAALGPELLLKSLQTSLREGATLQILPDPNTATMPAEYLVIEGKFLAIDPGSRAKRYWAGFGAGKSGVKVTGTVKDSSGKVLAEFTHMKHSGIGVGGGDYMKFLSDDTKDIGKDIGTFLIRWAAGSDLRED